jgi:DNA-binding beta-propeller fold protein YncE
VGGTARAVVAIDAATHEVLGSVPTGAGPAHMVLTPDGARLRHELG